MEDQNKKEILNMMQEDFQFHAYYADLVRYSSYIIYLATKEVHESTIPEQQLLGVYARRFHAEFLIYCDGCTESRFKAMDAEPILNNMLIDVDRC